MIRQFTSKNQLLGQKGEEIAVVFLMKQGFSIVERNSNSRHGEIDIVAKKKDTYYFFEVKAGKIGTWFNPGDNLTKEKLRKFYRAAEYYTLVHRIKTYKMQGIIVLIPNDVSGETSIEIIDLT